MPLAYIDDRLPDRIIVETTYTEKDLVKLVPGARWDSETKRWSVALSWGSCITLRGVFGKTLDIDPTLNDWARLEKVRRITPVLNIRECTETESWPSEYESLYPFQRAGADFLQAAGDALLADDMGTGKTVQALTAMKMMNYTDQSLPALVVCPNSVKMNWAREAEHWFTDANPYVIGGTPAQKSKMFNLAKADANALVIINLESLRLFSRLAPYGSTRLKRCRDCDRVNGETISSSTCEVHPKILNKIPFKTMIVDEAHRIKDPQAKQTRAAWAIAHGDNIRQRWAMTGTPIANHPGDLWSIMHLVAPQDYPARTKFIDRYCLMSYNPYGVMDIVGTNPEHREEFFTILDTRFRRMPKSLVLKQLPAKIRTMRFVEMSPKQAKAYHDLSEDLITRLDDGTLLVTPTNLSAYTRCLQLSSSYVEVTDTGDLVLKEPSPKLDELEVILEEMGDEPLVACAMSRQLIELAARRLEKLKIPYGMITGKVNQWQRQEALEDFQSGRSRVLLFTIAAGGTGLTMTRASTIVFLQRSWSMVDNAQAEDRVHRIGSEKHESINIIDIVTRDTLEQTDQLPALYAKFDQLQQILRDRQLLESKGESTFELDALETRLVTSHIGSRLG